VTDLEGRDIRNLVSWEGKQLMCIDYKVQRDPMRPIIEGKR